MPKEVVPASVLFHDHRKHAPLEFQAPAVSAYGLSQSTNEKGEYRFRRLAPGRYHARCHLSDRFEEREIEIRTLPVTLDFEVPPPKKGVWKTFTTLDGLAHQAIGSITVATNGVMWFGTIGGYLTRFDGY